MDRLSTPDLDHDSLLLADLRAVAGSGLIRVAGARTAIVGRLSGEDIHTTIAPQSDIMLIPSSPCRLSVRIDGSADQVLRLCPNTLMIFRRGRTYDIEYANCEKLLAIAVEPAWFEAIAEACSAHDPSGKSHVIDTILHPDIPPIVSAICRHLAFPRSPHERFLTLNVELLVSHYFWHQAAEHYEPPLSVGLSNGRLQKILETIEHNLENRIFVSDLARAAVMTPSQFSRSFKTALGMSPQGYILERRALKVQDLLEVTSMPLAEIAYETGFSSQAHMTATFSKKFGITPGEYRKHVGLAA